MNEGIVMGINEQALQSRIEMAGKFAGSSVDYEISNFPMKHLVPNKRIWTLEKYA
jgi:hypothetical protein